MKKTILTALIIMMVATPCRAEVEPDSLFSIEGTLWGVCAAGFVTIPPFIFIGCGQEIGFYQGKIYLCINNACSSNPATYIASYNDLIVVSLAYIITLSDEEGWAFLLAIMQPIGLGVYTLIGCYPGGGGGWFSLPPFCAYQTAIIYKINDNWTPPSE